MSRRALRTYPSDGYLGVRTLIQSSVPALVLGVAAGAVCCSATLWLCCPEKFRSWRFVASRRGAESSVSYA